MNGPAVARYHWQRMYSLGTLHSCLRTVPGYWRKDDHDAYSDDCYPGLQTGKMAPFTFPEGQADLSRTDPAGKEQPMYRRFRWGTDVEIWRCPIQRDYRSANPEPDGPSKTLWGKSRNSGWKRRSKTALRAGRSL